MGNLASLPNLYIWQGSVLRRCPGSGSDRMGSWRDHRR